MACIRQATGAVHSTWYDRSESTRLLVQAEGLCRMLAGVMPRLLGEYKWMENELEQQDLASHQTALEAEDRAKRQRLATPPSSLGSAPRIVATPPAGFRGCRCPLPGPAISSVAVMPPPAVPRPAAPLPGAAAVPPSRTSAWIFTLACRLNMLHAAVQVLVCKCTIMRFFHLQGRERCTGPVPCT